MTTPGATEAVTPEQRADKVIADWGGDGPDAMPAMNALIVSAIREAEANALRRAADLAEQWFYPIAEDGSEARVGPALGKAIRSLLPKEEGK